MTSLLSDAIAKTATHYQLAQTARERYQWSEQEVAARSAEFGAGRTPVNAVLQSQERCAEAQIDHSRALAEYAKSQNYISLLDGTLLAKAGAQAAKIGIHMELNP